MIYNRKRKSFTRKVLESFRERPKEAGQIVNKYVRNKLVEEDAKGYVYTSGSQRIFNSMKGGGKFLFSLDLKFLLR